MTPYADDRWQNFFGMNCSATIGIPLWDLTRNDSWREQSKLKLYDGLTTSIVPFSFNLAFDKIELIWLDMPFLFWLNNR